MSSIEIRLAPGINRRRQEISRIDTHLRELNLQFPGEREKPDAKKDPEYHALRSEILARRRALSGIQYQDREILRRVNGR